MKHNITVIPVGGLANRLRAIAAAYALAESLDCSLKVVWSKDDGLMANFSDIFRTDKIPFELIEISAFKNRLFYEVPRKRNLFISAIYQNLSPDKFIFHTGPMSSFPSLEDYKIILQNQNLVISSGSSFIDFKKDHFDRLFKVLPVIESKKAEILNSRNPIISCHIRRTDNHDSIKNSPLVLFESKVKEELEKNPSASIFIASDDEGVKRHFLEKFGSNILINPTPASRKTREGIIDAMAEMLILADSPRIYGSFWSSYSEIAALMGDSELIILKN